MSPQAQDIVSNKDNLIKLRENVMVACAEVMAEVESWKKGNEHINRYCKRIANTIILVSIARKKMYHDGEFDHAQESHIDKVKTEFKEYVFLSLSFSFSLSVCPETNLSTFPLFLFSTSTF